MATDEKPLLEIIDRKEELIRQIDRAVKERLDFHQNLIYAVLVVTVAGFVAIVVAVFDIFIQNKRFEAEKYSEYMKVLELQNNLITDTQNKNLQFQLDQIKTGVDLCENKYPVKR